MNRPQKEPPPPRQVLTSKEKASLLLSPIEALVVVGLEEEKVQISSNKSNFPKTRKVNCNAQGQPYSLSDYEADLKSIHSYIQQQKVWPILSQQAQQQYEHYQRQQAQQFVLRMKKQKAQQKLELQHRSQSALRHRVFSETALHQMRDRLQARVDQKREEIKQRIQQMEEKSTKRRQEWAKRAQDNGRKERLLKAYSGRNLSMAHLRRGKEGSLDGECGVPRKGSLQFQKKAREGRIEAAIELARNKEAGQYLKLEKIQGKRLAKVTASNRKLASQLEQGQVSVSRYDPFRLKMQGGQFLKESLLRAKKKPPLENPELSQLVSERELELSGRQARVGENVVVERLREKWRRVLERMREGELSQEQGLLLLHSMEGRLDRVDVAGIRERLRLKMQALQQGRGMVSETQPSEEVPLQMPLQASVENRQEHKKEGCSSAESGQVPLKR